MGIVAMDSFNDEYDALTRYLRKERKLNRWHERLLLVTALAEHAANDPIVFDELKRETAKVKKDLDPSVA